MLARVLNMARLSVWLSVCHQSEFYRNGCTDRAGFGMQVSEIIMVRDAVLSLPTWFSRDLIDDVLSSVCA